TPCPMSCAPLPDTPCTCNSRLPPLMPQPSCAILLRVPMYLRHHEKSTPASFRYASPFRRRGRQWPRLSPGFRRYLDNLVSPPIRRISERKQRISRETAQRCPTFHIHPSTIRLDKPVRDRH